MTSSVRRGQSLPSDDSSAEDPRLLQAVQEYLAELEAGHRPNRDEYLRRHPDIAGPLAECIEGLDLVHQAAAADRRTAPNLHASSGAGDLLPANPLGDFQILREVGRGGMGIVYEAVQLSLGRRVALKVLPFAATFDAKHLQRFHNEAQAAARLHHTNIVPVYAVGCERGMHFYAMQLIDGLSLATIIDDLRHSTAKQRTGVPRTHVDSVSGSGVMQPKTVSKLSAAFSTQRSSKPGEFFRAAARLIVQAAEALEHAHQFGIIHRDVKPANLLVDRHGQLWITDFGLAQFHADGGLTKTGDILGTLRYMSPEQASGRRVLVDHRTDVYSLGATLYELVTLEPIFSGADHHELLKQILHDEARAPRVLEKTLPIELETIILKAVGKHPSERYGSAREMAADLQRYLDDQPILARRPTIVERVRKWARRHPAVVGSSMLLLIICTMGLLVSNWMISREQNKTKVALANEKQRAIEARRAVDLLVEVAEEELADNHHSQGVRRRLLETALLYYQNFLDTQGSDAVSQSELTASKERVRKILDELLTLEGANLVGLVSDEPVQTDIKLTEAQRQQLAEFREQSMEQRMALFRDQRSFPATVRRQKFYDLAKTQETTLSVILSAEQLKRLRQIALQTQGPRAFHDSYAVDVLRLTPEQKRRIRDIRDETMGKLFDAPPMPDGPGGPGGPKFMKPKLPFEQTMKGEVERIIELLSPEQKKQWRELTGEPYRGNLRMFPPGPFGPQGPPPPPPPHKD